MIRPAAAKIEVFCHATEEPALVRGLIERLVPAADLVREETLFGHHKNRIIKFSAQLRKKEELAGFLARIPAGFVPDVDGNPVFFRLAKDPLLSGEWREAAEGEQAVAVEMSFQSFGGEGLDGTFFAERKWEK